MPSRSRQAQLLLPCDEEPHNFFGNQALYDASEQLQSQQSQEKENVENSSMSDRKIHELQVSISDIER